MSFASQLSAHISDEAIDLQLIRQLEEYAIAARELGYKNPIFSKKSLEQLAMIPTSKKTSVIHFLKLCTEWVSQAVKSGDDISDRAFLRNALEHYGLVADEDFLRTIDEETVVEIYSEDMVQLYRSFKMLDMTGYSLLDLSLFEWFVLWERPHLTIQQMQNGIATVLKSEMPLMSFEVTPHLLRETFNTGMTEPFIPKSALVRFQHIGFLSPSKSGAPRAFICTAKGEIIAEGTGAMDEIAFL
jgi:hypothetical protein